MICFISVMLLLLPAVMIIISLVWRSHPPKKINYIYGYRTARSMASPEAWEFAHKHFAKRWLPLGIILEVVTAVVIFLFRKSGDDALGIMAIGCMIVQMAVLIMPIFITEKALKEKFDRDRIGN